MEPTEIAYYEGLVFTTAVRIVRGSDVDLDDVRQELRIKVWRALESYDPARCATSVKSYVFTCVVNGSKDVLKRKRHGELLIEDVAPDDFLTAVERRRMPRSFFEHRYLGVEAEQVFGSVEDEGVLVPSTLTERERAMLLLLYYNWREPNASEVGRELGLTRSQVETTVNGLRAKLADWRPSSGELVELRRDDAPTSVAA